MAHAKVTMAMGLAVLMALSTLGAPVAAQEAVVDPRQPSTENPHMHVYGSNDLANCFMHLAAGANATPLLSPPGTGTRATAIRATARSRSLA